MSRLRTISVNLFKRVSQMRAERGVSSQLGDLGDGAGKGGGGGGSIRSAGGAFGRMEAAREEEYFYKLQKEQLHNIKDIMEHEVKFHEDRIKVHQEAINNARAKLDLIANKK